ncbi:hypothetical protein L1049_012390 [Liquidambar formosana]|uniref:F-box domain-containing protein n=1 Tax=Liquidambar formosana TaxID=63359 RepID=A0AAP0N4W4_LIQFO
MITLSHTHIFSVPPFWSLKTGNSTLVRCSQTNTTLGHSKSLQSEVDSITVHRQEPQKSRFGDCTARSVFGGTMTSSGEDTSVDLAEQSPAAAEEIAGNEDLLGEILLRLPVKSLLRFESVSKRWLFLICNPHFAQSHTRRHNPNLDPSGLLLNHEYAGFQFAPSTTVVTGLGLGFRIPMTHISRFYSPAIKQFNAIRFNSKFEDSLDAIILAFDPLKSPYFELILIREVKGRTPHTHRIDIYSPETRSLTRPASGSGHRLTFTAPPGISLCDAVYCIGAIHWNSDGETSLYFDTHTGRLNPMPMPPFGRFDDVRYFGESRGHLHIVMDKNSATEFDIWELKADYSGWLVKYRVSLDAVMVRFRDGSWNLQEKCEAFSHCV